MLELSDSRQDESFGKLQVHGTRQEMQSDIAVSERVVRTGCSCSLQ